MLNVQVTGIEELNRAMRDYEREFRTKDSNTAILTAGRSVMDAGARLCPPGDKERELIPASNRPRQRKFSDSRTKGQRKDGVARKSDEISDRTDTQRKATHFVKFYRQNKPPAFVPVTLNPSGKRSQKRVLAATTAFWLPLQRTRKGPVMSDKSNRDAYAYDDAREIKSLRKIGRRGYAALSFRLMKGQIAPRQRAVRKTPPGGVRADKYLRKWTSVNFIGANAMRKELTMHSKLTYLQKRYQGAEGAMVAEGARALNGQIRERLAKRAAKLRAA